MAEKEELIYFNGKQITKEEFGKLWEEYSKRKCQFCAMSCNKKQEGE